MEKILEVLAQILPLLHQGLSARMDCEVPGYTIKAYRIGTMIRVDIQPK